MVRVGIIADDYTGAADTGVQFAKRGMSTSILMDLKRIGRSVALIRIGDETPQISTNGLPVYHVSDDVPWEQVDKISLKGMNID